MPSLTVPERGTIRHLPFRRGVRYHDLLAMTGIAGIGLSLDGIDGADRVYVVVDSVYRGLVAFGALARHDLTPEQNLRVLVATGPEAGPPSMEAACLAQVLPGRLDPPPGSGDHAMARAAVSGSRLPDAMRMALNAVLDHGPPDQIALIQSMRRETGDAMWETLGAACIRPSLLSLFERPEVRAFLVRRAEERRPRLIGAAPVPVT